MNDLGGKTHYFRKHPYESSTRKFASSMWEDGIDDLRLRPQPFPGVQLGDLGKPRWTFRMWVLHVSKNNHRHQTKHSRNIDKPTFHEKHIHILISQAATDVTSFFLKFSLPKCSGDENVDHFSKAAEIPEYRWQAWSFLAGPKNSLRIGSVDPPLLVETRLFHWEKRHIRRLICLRQNGITVSVVRDSPPQSV